MKTIPETKPIRAHKQDTRIAPQMQPFFSCCGALYKFAMVWPLGGIFSFIWCLTATSTVTRGIGTISDAFETLGLDISMVGNLLPQAMLKPTKSFLNYPQCVPQLVGASILVSSFISTVNFVVLMYGLRESIRIYCGCLQHCKGGCILGCITCCVKFW
jgi:hypothetical protein